MSSSAVVIHGLRSILLGSLVVFACSTTRVAHDLPPTPRETTKQPTEQAEQKSTSITGEAETSEISATSSVESSAGERTTSPIASVHTLPSWRPPNLDLDGDNQADIAWLNFVWSPFTTANARRLVRLPKCRACSIWSDWTPIGDVDHDGFGDAWVKMPEKQLWFGGPDGLVATDFPASIPSVGTDVEPIPLGDFDGDSYDDILIPKVGIGFGNGRASMDVVTVPELPRILPVGDVDGDGLADMLALYPVPEVIFGGARQIAALSRLSLGIESSVATSSWSVARDHGKAMIAFLELRCTWKSPHTHASTLDRPRPCSYTTPNNSRPKRHRVRDCLFY